MVRGCASLICFGRAVAGLENQSHLKVGPTDLTHSADSEKVNKVVDININLETVNADSLKSSLKRPTTRVVASVHVNENECKHECGDTGTRKVQWTDVFGGDLFEIREFEPSEHNGSDDEFENGNQRICSCKIF